MANTKQKALIARMLSYTGDFDGFTSSKHSTAGEEDVALIYAAAEEQGWPSQIAYVGHLAATHAKTPLEYEQAKRFIEAWVQNEWDANMFAGNNPVYMAQVQ